MTRYRCRVTLGVDVPWTVEGVVEARNRSRALRRFRGQLMAAARKAGRRLPEGRIEVQEEVAL